MRSTVLLEAGRDRGGLSWYGTEVGESNWRMAFPDRVIAELERHLSFDPTSGQARSANVNALWLATHDFLDAVRQRLSDGPGVVVATGLPFSEWGGERSRQAIETLAPLIGPLMCQTHTGRLYYDVRDTGATYRPGVRRSLTNAPQPFHTDGPWTADTPEQIGLFCLQPSPGGGVNRCISLFGLLDDLAARDAQAYQRLAEPLPWHRQGEHDAGESPNAHHALWWRSNGGARGARLYTDYVHSGARLEGIKLDAVAVRALDTVEELAIEPHRWLEFTLGKGDVLWLNNRACAHARTGFESRGVERHLVRTWHRAGCSPSIDP